MGGVVKKSEIDELKSKWTKVTDQRVVEVFKGTQLPEEPEEQFDKSLCRHPDHRITFHYAADLHQMNYYCKCGRRVRPTRWVVVRK